MLPNVPKERERILQIINGAIDIVIKRRGLRWMNGSQPQIEGALYSAIPKYCDRMRMLIEQPIEKLKTAEEAQAQKKKIRYELAVQLKNARQKLREMTQKFYDVQDQISHCRELFKVASGSKEYPPVPPACLPFSEEGDGLPMESGIYFAWEFQRVAYVGQSVNLKARVSKNHHALKIGDQISWLPFSQSMLNWAESYYIGICMPWRNFGRKNMFAALDGRYESIQLPRSSTDGISIANTKVRDSAPAPNDLPRRSADSTRRGESSRR